MDSQSGYMLVFDPAKDDLNTLPEKVVDLLERRYFWQCDIDDFQRRVEKATPDQYVEISLDYVKLVRTSADESRVDEINDEIKSLNREIQAGSDAWEEGGDPDAMASCDPSDQYCKGEEVEELKKELSTLFVQAN